MRQPQLNNKHKQKTTREKRPRLFLWVAHGCKLFAHMTDVRCVGSTYFLLSLLSSVNPPFVTERPVSALTTQFLEWCCTRLQAQGKTARRLLWDNASQAG